MESFTGLAGSLITPTKGLTTQQLTAVVTFIKRQGFEQSILQCDGEPALVKLVEEIGKQTSLTTRQSQAYNHRSEEWQSKLFAQFRALLLDFCSRHKLRPSHVHIGGSFSQHMLRHAEWLLHRSQLHSGDNQTSSPGRWGIATSVLPFGEPVLTSDLSLAIWLGRCDSSDEHILAKANGNSLVTSTSVTRLSLESSMELALFKSTSIPALEPASVTYLETAKRSAQPLAQAGGDEQLRMEIPPQAYNHHPQHKLLSNHQQPRAISFQPPLGLAQPSPSPAYSCEVQQHDLRPTTLHTPGVHQPASSPPALIAHNSESTMRRQLSAKPATSACEKQHAERIKSSSQQASQNLGKGSDLPRDRACSQCFRRRTQTITRSSAQGTAS